MVPPTNSALKKSDLAVSQDQLLQVRGYSIILDKFGNFAGYSDDSEDIQNTKNKMEEFKTSSGGISWWYRTDIPWENPP
jgi:hypothetical protein